MLSKKFFFQHLLTILLAVSLLFSVSVMTAAADPGDGGDTPVGEEGGADPGSGGDLPGSGSLDIEGGNADNGAGDNGNTPEVSAPEIQQDPYQENEYINNYEDIPDNLSQYTPNENLSDLPEVTPADVEAATAAPRADNETSDATLFSGIIMWLCVAVGISVVAGVMVSKRTHRRGA